MQDVEFNPKSEEDLLREEQERELARRIRREVRRINSGEADEDILADEEQEADEQRAQEEARRRQERRQRSLLWMLASGTIMLRSGVEQNYRYALTIAGMFLISIIAIFNALRIDMKYTRTEHETQLLREKSIRLQERRYQCTTYSALCDSLQRRGIPLYDASSPSEIIE